MDQLIKELLNIDYESLNLSFIKRDIEVVCNHFYYSKLRLAVFAPFNHGKSTLINAFLGTNCLPINLFPTTATAIVIKYGQKIKTRIITHDHQEIYQDGTEILQQFAVLDHTRQIPQDILSIEVEYPHPLLAKGVELIDLPGTNDIDTQDEFIYNQLLTVDLVIPVIDARKPLSMSEMDKLRNWLFHRGINIAIFVLNFMNLIEESEERRKIFNRTVLIAEKFRGNLPYNISNFYFVDALPALRSRLKNNLELALQSGIITFDSGIEQIVNFMLPQMKQLRFPRIQMMANKIYNK
ncbi:dynamin family protein [Geminocystis sp. GBBB08]|uniref:dynamin family protein n=1 Tax=Geminocystis sp. GBBB08 TaxID=2604140 RepID=UPI0027E2C085|nr:dynamin family protein [Geminocystis sp. GBBB08]MBL1208233.1 hypothetical protein [Geminocystis sp. GBBB08]